ncbi:MAG: anhydro-N-acetylmuramic acid kinase [Cyclobacteriaceae bacterium]|nr:anhydro-N-acetylmuramic acid kinase [Cyclobacteriaceae bacterium]
MNRNISKLHTLASKKSRLIIGLMSGTSMDGLDVALCKVSGNGLKTKLTLQHFHTVPYSVAEKERILEIFAKPQVDFAKLTALNSWLGILHGQMVLSCLKKWSVSPARIDCIASHGQTVMHAPLSLRPESGINSTFQAGDGDHVAVTTGIITVSDFRQKHIAAGGEGAPLAVYGDYLLLSHKKENRILLNIGGIANFTFLPAGQRADKVFVTDTGPGNTIIDQVVRHYYKDKYFDKDAQLASQGTVLLPLLRVLKANNFFDLPFPKTTGPELFNIDYLQRAQQSSQTTGASVHDVLATVTRFSSETISEAIKKACGKKSFELYVSGGGAHNPLMMRWIKDLLRLDEIKSTEALGIPGDAKEAILFAVLANESLAGGFINFGRRGKIPSVSMGKISFPT